MQIDFLNREELQEFIFQFEQALYNHQQWYNSIIRSLVCRLPSDQHDVSVNAHKECRFGQWYYGPNSHKLKQHAAFIALGEEHHYMHKAATTLLVAIDNDNKISPHDYDIFSNSIEKLHLEISALQRELNELLYSRDSLTGTINRNNMLPILREQQELVKRQVQLCCIAMLDLDKFKNLNDQHGHLAGDCVLATVSRFIIENMRPYDKVFRVGGDEFLLCLQNTNTVLALEILERIRSGIAKMAIHINNNESVHTTVSMGLTSLKANISIEQAIEQADQALYKAKNEGRNCIRII